MTVHRRSPIEITVLATSIHASAVTARASLIANPQANLATQPEYARVSFVSLFRVNVVARNPKNEDRVTPPIEAIVDTGEGSHAQPKSA